MTDPDIADSTYIEPISIEYITEIIKKEKPDAILPTVGGQTALNRRLNFMKKVFLKNTELSYLELKSVQFKKRKIEKNLKKQWMKSQLILLLVILFTHGTKLKLIDTINFPVIIRPSLL